VQSNDPRKPVKNALERDFGNLHNNSVHLNKWLRYGDKACERLPRLLEAETDSELQVEFAMNPKMKVLVGVLDKLNLYS
jgi:hypothetical protein